MHPALESLKQKAILINVPDKHRELKLNVIKAIAQLQDALK